MGEGLGEQLAWSRPRWQGDKSTAAPMLSNARQQRGCPCLGSPWLCRSQGLGSQPGVCGGRILKKSSHHTKGPLSRRPCDTHLRAGFDSGGDRGQHKERRQGGRRSTWLLPRVPGQPWASAQPPLNGRPGAGMLSLETLLRRTVLLPCGTCGWLRGPRRRDPAPGLSRLPCWQDSLSGPAPNLWNQVAQSCLQC